MYGKVFHIIYVPLITYLGTFIRREKPTGIKNILTTQAMGSNNIPSKISNIPKDFLLNIKILRRKTIPKIMINGILDTKRPSNFTNESFAGVFNT